jgi:two-component system sensor histidine kinase DesK
MRILPDDTDLGWTPFAWVLYIGFFAAFPAIKRSTSVIEWALTLGGLVLFLIIYFYGFWVRNRRAIPVIAALTLMGLLYFPFNPGAGSFFIYAAAFAGWLDPPRRAIRAIAIIEVLVLAETLALQINAFNAMWPLVFSVVVGALNMHQRQVKSSNARLRLAHDEITHLAKVAERERIARDLHDLLGHTLSVIILKSELASKLAERDVDRARSEIRDVEQISRDALAQVRNAVRGYRAGGLREELDQISHTLETAGVATEIVMDPLPLTPAHEAVTALAIREAATNIVRHANATRCRIAITRDAGGCRIAISDDGRGTSEPFGSGLTGMRERVESLGGTLTRDGGRGTTLTIIFPMQPIALGASA